MNRPSSTDRHLRLIRELFAGIAERAAAEEAARSAYDEQMAGEQQQFHEVSRYLSSQIEQQKASIQEDFDTRSVAIHQHYQAEYDTTQSEFDEQTRDLNARFRGEIDSATKDHEDAAWMVSSVLDETAEDSPKQQYEMLKATVIKTKPVIDSDWEALDESFGKVIRLMKGRRQWREFESPQPMTLGDNPLAIQEQFSEAIGAARQQIDRLKRQVFSRFFRNRRPAFVFIGLMVFTFSVLYVPIQPMDLGLDFAATDFIWMAVCAGTSLAVTIICYFLLFAIARSRSGAVFLALQQNVDNASRARRAWSKLTKEQLEQRQKEFKRWNAVVLKKRDTALQKAESARDGKVTELNNQQKTDLRELNNRFQPMLQDINERREIESRQIETEYTSQMAAVTDQYDSDLAALQAENAQRTAHYEQQYAEQFNALADKWLSIVAEIELASDELLQKSREQFPEWDAVGANNWELPGDIPHSIRIGQFDVDLERIENGVPDDERLHPGRTQFSLPVLLPFPDNPSLLLSAQGQGREAAIASLQDAMLRLLTSIPPGKIRFTVVDPVGLGENFSAFMHLADFDELMITNRIWTEANHIEQRLADLTEHMENVFQKYLRNEFESIQEYNEHAGEVAEPYHILVVANFPANFSEQAARRLISVATSGPRCGVYTLISVDTRQPLPPNFDLSDLEHAATTLSWHDDRFLSIEPELQQVPLVLDAPPSATLCSHIIKSVGRQSKDSRRVEVAFSRVAPKDDQLWTCDSRHGIEVALGRAGATKLQFMRLGKGTSQHVLVAGKTGSGKSTLLHALITNLALHYGPDEVEFFLIDFKKGVEFKTYATHELPHARVIAIESDREFGVSVLERLDGILKERGDLFRHHGVQDIAAFRDSNPDVRMPRLLLIVDEFQEFFVKDDKFGQTASLLLDRLVRQGRAFGIHVLLGSQTLGGAYSLARSTLGQVAVRIALQCSEADAHLILSESNTAARLLTRPGEAIYNDANGMLEGNNPFQTVWLPDDRREQYLQRLQEKVREQNLSPAPAIVFEGNIPADPTKNHLLRQVVEADEWLAPNQPGIAWLGEAVAIKDASAVVLRRQSGVNMLIVGQSSVLAQGVLASSLISLAAQYAPADSFDDFSGCQFFVLDGNLDDDTESEAWTRTADAVPHPVKIAGPRDAVSVVDLISAEIARREETGQDREQSAPMFLVVFNVGRFRDLRKDDDDFGFAGFDKSKPTSTGKQFSEILKNGPSLGVHTLVWCDTYNNANRWFSTQTLREFETRVVFQMSATDSSNLIDTPLAGRLGANRALLYLEEQGTLEKFRPYGLPSDGWLSWVRKRLFKRHQQQQHVKTSQLAEWDELPDVI